MKTIEQRLAALEQEVTGLRAQQDLRSLLSQYAIAVDDKEPARLRRLFTRDARVHIPEWNVDVSGIDAVMDFYANYWSRFDHPRRYFANEDFKIDGARATCFMYWHVTQEHAGEAWLGWGTYHWAFRHAYGAWKIASVLITLRAMTTLKLGWAGAHRFAAE